MLASSIRSASLRSRQHCGGVRVAKAGQEIVVLGPEAALGLPGWRVTRNGWCCSVASSTGECVVGCGIVMVGDWLVTRRYRL